MQKRKKLTNAVSLELEGFRRPKQAQMKGNIVKMVQEPKSICIDGVGGFYQYYIMQIRKKLTNAVSLELKGFRRPKQTQMKGNIVKMVQELTYIPIDGVGGLYQSYYNANKKKLRNKVSLELEVFRSSKQAQMKGNFVEMVQSTRRIDVVGGFYLFI